jgi:aspartyl-tRNA(Asn)/glutamyl-tRNA(Gln) amidotransferase subunit A
MVPLATGSDGGGSIRIPSACCGLSGMKPSLGRVPAGGPNPPGWIDLSTNGPMARRIADVARALDVAVGPDPSDLRALPRPEASWLAAIDDAHVPVRVAYAPTLGYARVDAEVAAACERAVGVIESMGAEIVVLNSVFDDDPVGHFLTMTGAATLRTLRPFMGHPRWEEVHPVLRHFVDAAQSTTAEQLLKVFDHFHFMNLRLVELFHTCRILVTPTCSGTAPFAGEMTSTVNGETTVNWIQFTYPFNMTRSPAATVPVGFSSGGLPIGLQLIGPQHGDLVVLRAAAALEAAMDLDTLAVLPD